MAEKMKLPAWCLIEIDKLNPPRTGKVEIVLELYNGGVTKVELGGFVRVKPDGETVRPMLRESDPGWCRKCGVMNQETWYICRACEKDKREPGVKY